MMLPAGHQQAASSVHYITSCTQYSAPEDGRNYRLKHVELIEIIKKIITVASSWLFILLYDMYAYVHSHTHAQIFLTVCNFYVLYSLRQNTVSKKHPPSNL